MNIIPHGSIFDFDRVLDSFFAPSNTSKKFLDDTFSPRVDVKDKGKQYLIVADLPGVKKEDLNLSLDNGVLSIEASTSSEHNEKEGETIIRQERFSGRFVRSFNVGSQVTDADIKAEFKDGVLKLTVPKTKEAEVRKIPIN